MTTDGETAETVNPDFYLEIACFDVNSLLFADSAGADRTEICTDRASGGVTAPLKQVLDILPLLQNPAQVMIRPRGGNFVYSDAEFKQMKFDIRTIKSASALGSMGGFVFGILDASCQVDVSRNSELVASAEPFPCTFHRAFDETKDLDKALEDVINCGFKTILTSGGAADAVSGADVLSGLVAKASGRITIMPGGGVRSSNIKFLKGKTKANWYHSSAVVGNEMSAEEVSLLKQFTRGQKMSF